MNVTRRAVVAFFPLVLVLALPLLVAASPLRINFTRSLPRGLYLRVDRPRQRGQIVAACLPASLAAFGRSRGYLPVGRCGGDGAPVLKRIVASSGDTVSVTTSGVRVNGHLEANSRPLLRDHSGRALGPAVGEWHLTAGDVWLATDNPYGWDSRYWGPIPRSWLLDAYDPLWVER